MPNTTPIPELIAVEIESRLNTILMENGYSFDVSEVVRPTRRGENWQYKHLGIGILQGESARVPSLDCPGNPAAICYAVQFNLLCICKDSANSEQAHATNSNEMAAASVKAITSNSTTWQTLDDNAINTEIGSPRPLMSPEGENNGTSVPLLVFYRVSENNPYEVRG